MDLFCGCMMGIIRNDVHCITLNFERHRLCGYLNVKENRRGNQ